MGNLNHSERYRQALAMEYQRVLTGGLENDLSVFDIQRQFGTDLINARKSNSLEASIVQPSRIISGEMMECLPGGIYFYGPLRYDADKLIADTEVRTGVHLSLREHQLFHPLITYPEWLLPNSVMIKFWNYPSDLEHAATHCIRVVTGRLRRKLDDVNISPHTYPGRFKFVQTILGVGLFLKTGLTQV